MTSKKYHLRGSIHPREESMLYEFKGHRSFCPEELPNYIVPGSTRPSRQAISKYACGMLNTGKGGVILMGVLDDGRIEGFALTKFQQDHIMLTVEDTFERYNPPVPLHMYDVIFTPVIDLLTHQSPEEELEAITQWMSRPSHQDRTMPHQLRTSQFCWCDRAANAQFTLGYLNPFFIVELHLQSWDPKDVRNANLFSDMEKPIFSAEDGTCYERKFGSNAPLTLKMSSSQH